MRVVPFICFEPFYSFVTTDIMKAWRVFDTGMNTNTTFADKICWWFLIIKVEFTISFYNWFQNCILFSRALKVFISIPTFLNISFSWMPGLLKESLNIKKILFNAICTSQGWAGILHSSIARNIGLKFRFRFCISAMHL